jgi:rubrerythrin
MSIEFNADEIFEVAEQFERNGANFYREASENVADPKAVKMLLQLSQMEDDHEKTFKKLRVGLKATEVAPMFLDSENEIVGYLRALADTRVFFEKKIDLKSMKEILKAAIEAEKDTIAFYLGMKDMTPEDRGKRWIEEITKEEMSHVQLLSKELLALN